MDLRTCQILHDQFINFLGPNLQFSSFSTNLNENLDGFLTFVAFLNHVGNVSKVILSIIRDILGAIIWQLAEAENLDEMFE